MNCDAIRKYARLEWMTKATAFSSRTEIFFSVSAVQQAGEPADANNFRGRETCCLPSSTEHGGRRNCGATRSCVFK
jgi:hypothetical protein